MNAKRRSFAVGLSLVVLIFSLLRPVAAAPTPPARLAQLRALFHVTAIHFSDDGSRFMLGTSEGLVMVWDIEAGRLRFGDLDPSYSVAAVALSPDGGTAYRFDSDGYGGIRITAWDLTGEGEARRIAAWSPGEDFAAVHIEPGGREGVLVTRDGRISRWTLGEEFSFRTLREPIAGEYFRTAATSGDGRRVALLDFPDGGTSLFVEIHDLTSGRRIAKLGVGSNLYDVLVLDPDGEHVFTTGYDGAVRSWPVAGGESVLLLSPGEESAPRLALSADGRRLLAGRKVLDARTGKRISDLVVDSFEATVSALSPDGRVAACLDRDGGVILLCADTGARISRFVPLGPEDWLIHDPEGRHSVSPGPTSLFLYWVCGDTPIPFEVSSDRYSDPDLRHRAFSTRSRKLTPVPSLVGLPPRIRSASIDIERGVLTLELEDLGGGYGALEIRTILDIFETHSPIDGAERMVRAYSESPETPLLVEQAGPGVEIPLAKIPGYEPPYTEIQVRLSNRAGDLRGFWVRPSIRRPRPEPVPHTVPRLLLRALRLPVIEALVPSGDGKSLLVARRGGELCTWDLDAGAATGTISPPPAPPSEGLAPPRLVRDTAPTVAIGPGGEQLLTIDDNGKAVLRRARDGKALREFGGEDFRTTCVAISPDGQLAACGGSNGLIRVWSLDGSEPLQELDVDPERIVESVIFSRDGARLLCANAREIVLFDLETGRALDSRDSEASIRQVALAPDTSEAIVVDWAGDGLLVHLWTSSAPREAPSANEAPPAPSLNMIPLWDVSRVAYSPDGQRLLAVTRTGTVQVLRRRDFKELVRLGTAERRIDQAAWVSEDRIVTDGFDGLVRLWDAAEGTELCRFGALRNGDWAVLDDSGRLDSAEGKATSLLSVVTDGEPVELEAYGEFGRDRGLLAKHLGLAPEAPRAVQVRRPLPPPEPASASDSPGPPKMNLVARLGHAGALQVGTASADGRLLLTGSHTGEVLVWEVATGRELRRIDLKREVTAVAFSPDGRQFAAGLRDSSVHLGLTGPGSIVASWNMGGETVSSVEFSRDGRWLLAASDEVVALLDARSRLPTLVLPGQIAALSPDGERILIASRSGRVRLHERRSGRMVFEARGHLGRVSALAWAPDGETFLTADADEQGAEDVGARLWNASTGLPIHDLNGPVVRSGGLEYLPDGRTAISAGGDNILRIWDLGTGLELRRFADSSLEYVEEQEREPGEVGLVLSGWPQCAHDPETGERLQSFRGASHAINTLEVAPDGGAVFTACCCARRWNLRSGRVDRRYGIPFTGSVGGALCLGVTGAPVHTLDRFQAKLRRWAPEGGDEPVGLLEGAVAVTRSADGARLHVLTRDLDLLSLDSSTGAELSRVSLSGVPLSLHGYMAAPAVISADGRLVAGTLEGGSLGIHSLDTGRTVEVPVFLDEPLLEFAGDGRRLLVSGWDLGAVLFDTATGEVNGRLIGGDEVATAAAWSRDGSRLAMALHDGEVRIWNTESAEVAVRLAGHSQHISGVAFSPDERFLWTSSSDHTARLWDSETGRQLCTLISFYDGTWAVVDPHGRYDASHGGDVEGLYWVVGNESIALEQLKERFYDPGLLAKITGFNAEPLRSVGAIQAPALFPDIQVVPSSADRSKLAVRLRNRGGGIGRVVVRINRKEISADARAPGTDPNAEEAALEIDLTGDPRLIPGEKNRIEVLVYNAEGYLRSRGIGVEYVAPGESGQDPELWAIVAGASDYLGDAIDLRFAAKDARDFAAALSIAANRFLGKDRVHIRLLTTEGGTRPTRKSLEAAFEEAKQAKPTDILVLYLSGHGVNFGGENGDYFYLTSDARSADLGDPKVRADVAISSTELTGFITKIPALKQVLILDTCASGKVVDKLSEKRDVPGSQVRALDRLKDRTGLFVLAGCASDRVSFEATRFAQGLLTHSLLMGMKGAALRAEEYVDVATLFEFAKETVPKLAKDIGGIQRPVGDGPKGGSFDLGQLTEEDKANVPLQAARPLFLRSNFQPEEEFEDLLGISKAVDRLLGDVSARGSDAPLVFVDARTFPDACRIAGRYENVDGRLKVRFRLYRAGGKTEVVTVEGDPEDLAAVASRIVEAARGLLD